MLESPQERETIILKRIIQISAIIQKPPIKDTYHQSSISSLAHKLEPMANQFSYFSPTENQRILINKWINRLISVE
jgi:hypothetical protein